MAFIRVKKRGARRYAYLVESVWDADRGSPRQRVLRYLGAADAVGPEDVPTEHRRDPAVQRWLRENVSDADATYRMGLERVRDDLRGALLDADTEAVDRITRSAVDAYDAWTFLDEVATPLLHAIGEDWYEGRITVVDEHVVTRGLARVVRELRDDAFLPPAERPRDRVTVLLANPDGEMHQLALELLECRLIVDGHRTVVSTGGAPARDVAKRARELAADLVLVSVTLPGNVESAFRLADAVRERSPRSLVALGGQAWRDADAPRAGEDLVRVVEDAPAREALDALVRDAVARRHERVTAR